MQPVSRPVLAPAAAPAFPAALPPPLLASASPAAIVAAFRSHRPLEPVARRIA